MSIPLNLFIDGLSDLMLLVKAKKIADSVEIQFDDESEYHIKIKEIGILASTTHAVRRYR